MLCKFSQILIVPLNSLYFFNVYLEISGKLLGYGFSQAEQKVFLTKLKKLISQNERITRMIFYSRI